MNEENTAQTKNEIVVYQPNETIRLDVRLGDETVWLTQEQMGSLFGRDQSVIARHIGNIFKEGELDRDSVYAKFAYTAGDGKTYQVAYYNLDRFLILDDKELYLIGASLKDLGRKCFGFTKMDAAEIPHLKARA